MAIFAQMNPVFQPAMRIIDSITNSFPAVVTTTFNHQYITGTIVRLDIPIGFGMPQVNQKFGPIVVTGPTTFTIPIDTTFFDPFVPAVVFPLDSQRAQVVPFGEVNETLKAATVNVLNPNR